MIFIILHKTGEGLQGAELAAIIEGKKASEAEKAIAEGATKGYGSYVAIPVKEKSIVVKDVRASIEIVDPPEESESEQPEGD